MATRKTTRKSTARQAAENKRGGLLDYFRFGESYTSLVLGIVVVIITAILLVSFVKNRNIGQINETQPEIVATNDETQMATRAAEVTTTITGSPTRAATPTQIAQRAATATPTRRPTALPTKKATPTPTKAVPTPTRAQAQRQTPPTPTVKSKGTHTVASGETLWAIAEKHYNSGYNWVDIARANNLEDAGVLHTGNKLTLPSVPPKQITIDRTPAEPTGKITGSEYKVVKGDSLWSVAVRAYGDGFRWTEIAKNNNITNPNLIYAGTVLKLKR